MNVNRGQKVGVARSCPSTGGCGIQSDRHKHGLGKNVGFKGSQALQCGYEQINHKVDVPVLLAAQGSFLALSGPCAGYSGLAAGFTYQLEFLGVFKLLASRNEENRRIDARVQAGLHVKSLAVPGVRLGAGCRAGWMPTAPSLILLTKPCTRSLV